MLPPSVSRFDFLRPPRPGFHESERARRQGKRFKFVRFLAFASSQKWLGSSATFWWIGRANVSSEYPENLVIPAALTLPTKRMATNINGYPNHLRDSQSTKQTLKGFGVTIFVFGITNSANYAHLDTCSVIGKNGLHRSRATLGSMHPRKS